MLEATYWDFAFGSGVILDVDQDLLVALLEDSLVAFWGFPAIVSQVFPRNNHQHSKASARSRNN
jgi:hypothetical protein